MTDCPLPCGSPLPDRLRDQLAHYRACKDVECRKRIEAWQTLRRMLNRPDLMVLPTEGR